MCNLVGQPSSNLPLTGIIQLTIKMDTEISIPNFNGSANVEKLDEWIQILEVYFQMNGEEVWYRIV
jgi:hypothetical protein